MDMDQNMKTNHSLNDEIKEYLLENPELLNSKYAETAVRFNTHYERVRNIATNMALKNVGKHFGAKAAVGIAARIAGGLLSWPVALTIGAAQLAPVVYRQFKNEE